MARHLLIKHPLLCVACAVLAVSGCFIAWHHPLGGSGALLAFLILLAIGFAQSAFALVIVPALMPIIDLAPWSGWLTFEEFDLLVLALSAGAYLRFSLITGQSSILCSKPVSPIAKALIMVFTFSVLICMFRGLGDAGGFVFGWFQGYYEPMNSVRLAKSFLLALVLMPLWMKCNHDDHQQASRLLATGMGLGLGLAGLAAIWERLAFTGLLNFTEDYRTTALFWETHVGGAAFDGFLALTMPFSLWMLLRAGSRLFLVVWGGIFLLAGYACLTTFSRGVYLAIPAGLATMLVLSLRQRLGEQATLIRSQGIVTLLAIAVCFGTAAHWIFPSSGYRGMLAVLLSLGLLYPVASALGSVSKKLVWTSLSIAGVVTLLLSIVGFGFSKGAYVVFAFGIMSTATGLAIGRGKLSNGALITIVSGYLTALFGCLWVALHWGGEGAAEDMAVVVSVMVVAMGVGRVHALPAVGVRWHAGLIGVMVAVGLGVATFGGGAYMSSRFSTSGQDIDARFRHWTDGMAQMNGADWWLGKGLGRYPATHFFASLASERPGGYRLESSGTESYLRLSGGEHINGWGEIFRVTQRVSPGSEPYKLTFDAMAEQSVQLHFEVCEKHLLYNGSCVVQQIPVKGIPGAWQKLSFVLPGSPPSRGAWYAPRIVAFSVAMDSRGAVARIDNLSLVDGQGAELLSNGGFTKGLAYWFSSSDKHHMPWHMKSLYFHTLFDQGLIGFGVFLVMILATFFRLTVGEARKHPLAPAILGSVTGFLVVGVFDSLVDVPRLATLYYFVLMMGLTINTPSVRRLPPYQGSNLTHSSMQGT